MAHIRVLLFERCIKKENYDCFDGRRYIRSIVLRPYRDDDTLAGAYVQCEIHRRNDRKPLTERPTTTPMRQIVVDISPLRRIRCSKRLRGHTHGDGQIK